MINLASQIPGWLTDPQLRVLARLASELPSDASILEIGATTGQSSLCLLESSPPSASLCAIGGWTQPIKSLDRPPLRNVDGSMADQSLLTFRERLRNYAVRTVDTNKPILTAQQQLVAEKFDLIFLYEGYDEVHFEVQLDFWLNLLKPVSTLCGADFIPGFRNLVKTLLRYCNRKRLPLEIEQNIWQINNALQS